MTTSIAYQNIIAEIAAHNEIVATDPTKAYSITQLTAFIERLSGAIPEGARTSVFYGGHLLVDANGTALPDSIHSSDIVSLLPKASNGQIASLSETEVYKLTQDPVFKDAFRFTVEKMGFSRNSPQGKALWAGGVDPASGQPLGIFDVVSKVFARDAAGNVMVVSTFPENSRTGIFALHELPELLKNSKVTHINGIDISSLRAMAQAPDGFAIVLDRIKAQSALDLAYMSFGKDSTGKITSIDTTTLLSSKYGLIDIHDAAATEKMVFELNKIKSSLGSINLDDIRNLPPSIIDQIKINEGALVNKGVILVGVVIALITASQSAQAAAIAGNHEEAAIIMRDWAGELVGALIGGAIFAAGVAGAIPAAAGAVAAGVVILAGGIVGSVLGADVGKWLFENTGEIGLTLGRLLADANSNAYDMFTSYYNAALTDPVYRQKFLELGGYANPLDPALYSSKSIYDPLTEKGAYSSLYVKEKGLAEWYKYLAVYQNENSPTKVNVDSNGNISVGALPTESDGSWIYQFAGDNKKITYAPFRSREHFILFGSDAGPDLLEGRAYEDHLYGGGGSDVLKGKGGNDYLEGGDWDDQLFGDEGKDKLLGMTGDDHLYGGSEDDILLGGSGNDQLFGGSGSDYLHGGSGDDQLFGEQGNDILIGGQGAVTLSDGGDGNDLIYADNHGGYNDILVGGNGNDVIYGFNGNNLLTGGTGNDLLYGGANVDNLVGGSGNDIGLGADGIDVLLGNDGNDFLSGGNDNDSLEGEVGADRLDGGEGFDNYLYRQSDFGTDVIADSDGQGVIFLDNYTLAVGDYNQSGGFWNSTNNLYEIRKVGGTEGRTTLIINRKLGDKNTIFVEDWQGNGDLGLTFSEKPEPEVIVPQGALVTANEKDNIIYGQSYVQAGAGNDYIAASNVSSNDKFLGGAGNDILNGFEGNDHLDGGENADILFGGAGNDSLEGGAGSDLISTSGVLNYSKQAIESMFDHNSDEWIEEEDKPDTIRDYHINYFISPQLDPETQSFIYYYNDNGVTSDFTAPWVIINSFINNNPVIIGTTFAPSFISGIQAASSESDTAYGGSGNDIILGSGGADYLDGGTEDDSLFGFSGNDELYGGSGADKVYGGDGRDFIAGGAGTDRLVGGYESDVIYGGANDDDIYGDLLNLKGLDTPPASADPSRYGDDLIYGDAGNDKLWGGGGNDTLHGGNDTDQLVGEAGDDFLFGENGTDNLFGGVGNDYLSGGEGTDYLYGDEGDDYLNGDNGDDHLEGDEGNDILEGGANNDRLFGGADNDILRGQSGVDELYGDIGDDILEGGTGNDKLYGGRGSDIYVFNLGDGVDTISEEQSDIKSLNYDNYVYFAFEASQVKLVHRDQFDLVIDYGVADQLRIKDYYKIRNSSSNTYIDDYAQFETIEISELRFEDGTVWGTQDVMQMAPPPVVNELPPDPLAGVAYFIDALVDRETVKVQGKTTVTYNFAASFADGYNFQLFTSEQITAVQQALSKYSDVLNIQFVQSSAGQAGDFTFYLDDLTSIDRGAAAGYASAQTGEIHLNSLLFAPSDALNSGSEGFEVLLHEIGHALGLKHPFEAPVLPEAENNQNNTVMSYSTNGVNDTNLQMYDIAALQYLHGLNLTTRTGNSTYSFNDTYIWDSAGIDTFDASAQTASVTLDLNEGGWSYVGSKNSSILAAGQSFIGYGTRIENAVGGSGDDILISSKLDNLLQGGLGQDTYRIKGGGQDKIIEIDEHNSLELEGLTASQLFSLVYSNQKLVYGSNSLEFDASKFDHIKINDRDYTYSQFIDAFSGSVLYFESNTVLEGNVFNAALAGTGDYSLTGNDKNNKLIGNSGNNSLDGSLGMDIMGGYLGDDTYIVDNIGDIVVEDAWEGNDSVISSVDYTLSENVENLKITGSALKAIGNEEDNIIEGNDNNNILDGGFGDDTMTGGLGDDVYYVGSNFDHVIENQNGGNDTVILSAEPNGAWLADDIENLILADNVINAAANYLDNVITGNSKNNVLEGMEGKDTYIFKQGSGQDTIVDEEGDITIQFQDVQPSAIQFVLPDAEIVQKWSYDGSYRYNSLEPSSNDLKIKYGNDTILLQNFFANTNSLKIVFPSGEEWSKDQVLQKITYTAHGDATVSSIQGYAKIKNYITTSYNEGVSIGAGVLDDTIYAGKGDDYIYASTGNNTLYSGEGNDEINAGNGNNLVYADKGDDYIKLGNGNQVVYAGEGDDHLILGSGNHTIQGDDGNDIIELGSGNHIVHGNQGNDNITIGDGQHQVYGDDGNDSINLSQFSGTVHGGQGDDSITIGSTSNQTIYGDDGDDGILFYNGSNNTLIGGQGNDTLLAGEGTSNLLLGGEGNDRLGAGGGSILDGGIGHDTYQVNPGNNVIILDADLKGGFSLDAEPLYFKWGDSPIYGSNSILIRSPEESLAQLVSEQSGSGWSTKYYQYTRFNSRMGSISYNAVTGELMLSKDQSIYFTLKNVYTNTDLGLIQNMGVSLEGQTGYHPSTSYNHWTYFNETSLSFAEFMDQGLVTATYTGNNDVIKGLTEFVGQANQGDVIYAGAGNDQINSGRGSSLIYGEEGDDIIIAPDTQAIDNVYGGAGNDTIYTYDLDLNAQLTDIPYAQIQQLRNLGASQDIISGGEGNDHIYLGDQFAVVTGDAGNDTLVAGNGGAYLDGGEGADHLIGGTGNDTFVVDEFDTFEEANPEGGYDTLHIAQSVDLNGTYLEAVTLVGQGNFYAKGNAAGNQLTGNDGNNLLDGRSGSDTMSGGLGDDYYVVDVTDTVATDGDGNTYIVEGDQVNEDFDSGIDTIERWQDDRYIGQDANGNPVVTTSYKLLQDNIENLVLKGDAKTAFGNDLNNIIVGNAQNNYIDGLGGDDSYVFAKGGGTDTYSFNDDIDAVNTLKISGYNPAEVYAQKQGNSVYFSFKNSSDHIWLSSYYVADSGGRTNKLDQIEFDSGVIWTQADIQTLVDRAATNRAPTVTGSIPQIVANQGTAFNYTVASNVITDPDTWDSLNYKVTLTTQTSGQYNPIPSWLTFDPLTRTLSGTPPTTLSGTTTYYFWGTDMSGLGTATSFTLKVNPPNRVPVIVNAIADQTVTDGKPFSYNVPANAFSDPDADALTYSATLEDGSTLPAWLSFNASTRTISGTSPDNSTPLNIKITAKDIGNLVVSDVFMLTFVVQNLTVNGTTGIDTLYGGSGNDSITGLGANDTLYGQSGNDSLDGGTGNDTMYGGKGDDLYIVDSTTDIVVENTGEGVDSVQSSVTYTLNTTNAANIENLTLSGTTAINATGNALNNVLTGNSANNTLTALGGDDTLNGAAGTDTLVGGTGNDIYIVDSTTDIITENANEGIDSIQSSVTYSLNTTNTANVENLTLTGTSVINATGNALSNIITGNSANNTLDGGTGADTLIGGLGDDSYVVENTADMITENVAEGTDSVQSAVTYTLSTNVENLTLTGTTAINATGNDLNNLLTGNSVNNTLTGAAGNDTLNGAAGIDTLIGGLGDDIYLVDSTTDIITENANEGIDSIQSSVTYSLSTTNTANVENLTLTGTTAINGTGNALNNILLGNSGNNTLTGGGGDDWMDGAAGTNILVGGAGNDTYILSVNTNTVTEAANEGMDTVQSALTYTLGATSNLENLTLTGTAAINGTGNTLNNILLGNSGNNTLTGGGGDDWLDGAAGTNTLVGGTGNDTYVISVSTNTLTEAANEGTDIVQSSITYTLGTNLENLTLTGSTAINGTGNTLANVLKGNTANNTLTGGTGNDTYQFDRNSAVDSIVENDSTAGNKDVLSFASDIAANQLWFVKSGNNLEVSVIGTDNKAIVKDWYLGNAYHVEELKSGNGLTLLDTQVQNLVQAMSGLTPPAGGQTTLPPEYQTQLNAVIAANWQ